jgi:hypothetical protein
MKNVIASAAVAAVIAAGATYLVLQDAGEKKGVIVVYRDKDNVCQTATTPYMKLNPSKVKWKIDDQFGCVTGTVVVTLEFPAGSLYACNGLSGTQKIECNLEDLRENVPATKYTVVLGSAKEDPELQIEI